MSRHSTVHLAVGLMLSYMLLSLGILSALNKFDTLRRMCRYPTDRSEVTK